MSNVLFVNGNLHGHINPTLPLVKELVSRGEKVYYFATKQFQEKLEASGAIFMDYGIELDQFLCHYRPHGKHPFYGLMEYMLAFDRAVISIVLSKVKNFKFDYLIHDVMFGGGNILAKQLNLPAIASCSSFVMEKPPIPDRMLVPGFDPQLDYLYAQMKEAEIEWDMNSLQISDLFFKKEALILVYTSRLFQPQGDSFGDNFKFIGPSINDRKETLDFDLNINGGNKLIYIAMGTVNNNCVEFYNKCMEAFSDRSFRVVMSVGSKTDLSTLNPIPDNFTVRSYLPQLEVLKHADVFLSHGGLNSVSEALYYGVPVIAIPMANDQPAVAKRLTQLGAGMELNMENITSELLNKTVHTILTDPAFQTHSEEIGATFRDAGGFQKGADEIQEYIKTLL